MKNIKTNVLLMLFAVAGSGEHTAEAFYERSYYDRDYYYEHDYRNGVSRYPRWDGYRYTYGDYRRHGRPRWARHDYGHWDYYRPSIYRDYYSYYPGVRGPALGTVLIDGKKPVAKDLQCDAQLALLKENDSKPKNEGNAKELVAKGEELKDKVLEACVPGWMAKASATPSATATATATATMADASIATGAQ